MMLAKLFFALSTGFVLRTAKWITVLSLSFLLLTTSLFSQQSDTLTNADRQTLQSLLDRIASLEASDKQLRERVAQLEGAPAGATAHTGGSTATQAGASSRLPAASVLSAAPKSEPTRPEPSPLAQSEQQETATDTEHLDVSKTSLNIRGFGDFGLYGGNQKGQTTSFSIGQTDLFITSNLSERFKFLTELVFEVHQDNAFRAVLERVLLDYSLNDYFNLSVGRYHTAIGYYNTAYHNATWFQTATERPYIFEYEDEGGILPIHMVGLEASGQIPSGRWGLHYVAEVGNGLASDPLAEPVQNYVDENGHKAVNIAVFARPDAIPGLQLGFSAYKDVISLPSSPKINETITDAYAVLTRPRFEWLNEALMIRHASAGEHVYETPAFYSQISERFGLYRPYFRYQYVNASSQEPLFPQVGLRTGPSVGIRFDPTGSVALKLQYDYTVLRRQQAIDGKSCPQLSMCAPSAVGMQIDFKF
jgi:hypothetical protein